MSKQPESLRLADWCDANSSGVYRPSAEAAAELRRLHSLNAELEAQVEALKADAARIDWLSDKAKSSRTGVSLDYTKYVEEGVVQERGFRVMSFHKLGDMHKDARAAIDVAMEAKQ